MKRPLAISAGCAAAACAGTLAYAVRGRSSQLLGPSVYRGPRDRRALALTFDDGPSESTPALLQILQDYGVPSTFFQCGVNVRRLPEVARQVVSLGHELGNHSETHQPLYFRPAHVILKEFRDAQQTLVNVTGCRPMLLRAPYGARWFGFSAMQRELQLRGVMWTVIGRDWRLNARQISARVLSSVTNGSIVCLHDGRELEQGPDVRSTLEAVRRVIPELLQRGFEFRTVSRLVA